MSKILLTGASGTLGRNFLELAGNAADLEILALLRDESRPIKRYKSVKECRADLNNSHHVSQIVRDFSPQTIIHCAATG
ncbi:MAG: sugar nucleotide-binding protein, partial [Chthoniobacterales bacterium]